MQVNAAHYNDFKRAADETRCTIKGCAHVNSASNFVRMLKDAILYDETNANVARDLHALVLRIDSHAGGSFVRISFTFVDDPCDHANGDCSGACQKA